MIFELYFYYDKLDNANPKYLSLFKNLLAYSACNDDALEENLWDKDFLNLLQSDDVINWDMEKCFTWTFSEDNELYIYIEGEMSFETISLVKKVFVNNFGGECVLFREVNI